MIWWFVATVCPLASSLVSVAHRIFHDGSSKVCCVEGGLSGTRHTSVSSDMTSSGLRLSRQQFFPLIHSCNEINQANSKSREFNPWIWQLWCGPLLVQEIWRDKALRCLCCCASDTIGQFSLTKFEDTLGVVGAKIPRLAEICARSWWSMCRVTCYVTT